MAHHKQCPEEKREEPKLIGALAHLCPHSFRRCPATSAFLPESGELPLAWKERDGTPGRIRTCDMRLRRPPFYPLNYGGIALHHAHHDSTAAGAKAANHAAFIGILTEMATVIPDPRVLRVPRDQLACRKPVSKMEAPHCHSSCSTEKRNMLHPAHDASRSHAPNTCQLGRRSA